MFHVTFELGQFNNFQYALIHDILFIALLFLKSQLTLIELKKFIVPLFKTFQDTFTTKGI
ncbi:MAG: hypothetical protein Q8S84_07100 [bacterium]|nr:hypothetical protein [bacterium]MDP3381223.1 hypothetical protein [bacterium]